jgi:FMN phosphatase YigB (HAD superfamily)
MTLRALLFDYGGTLDGGGTHWLDRFLHLYRAAHLELSFVQFRAAFDYATQCAYREPRVAGLDLQGVVAFHVEHHLQHLGVTDEALARRVIGGFVDGARRHLLESRRVLARLQPRIRLGVLSNFYGNVDRLLAEAGIAELLATIIDSTCVGVRKPDPAIFTLAVERLGCAPAEIMYVGDSFENDIVAAHAAGLRTAWLVGTTEPPCADPDLADVRLRCLAELEGLAELPPPPAAGASIAVTQ